MRARQMRTGGGRRAAVEPLEGRSYLSMTLDVRVAGTGGKTAAVTSVGQVVDLDAYAVISGTTAGSNDAFLDAIGSFLGTETGTGGVVGNLAATLIPTFVGSGASDGTQQDLNGDGGLDVGSNSTTGEAGYFAARSGDVDYDGAVSGDTNTFLLATLTYTVTSLGTGTATDVNFRASGDVGGSYSAVWYQGGTPYYEATTDANFLLGAPVVITGPTATPTPTGTRLTGTTYGTVGSYANDGNTIAMATDGSLNTFFDAPAASGGNVGIDLGSAKTVTAIGYAPRSGFASRMVGGVFQVSTSMTFSSNVITVYTITATPTVGVLTKVAPNTSTAYEYWRYYGPANGYCDIAEFELFGSATTPTPTPTQLTGTTYGTAGSYDNDGDTIAMATDNNLNTFFDAPAASGGNVGIDLGSAKTVTAIGYAPRSGFASRMVGGVFQVSTSMTFSSNVITVYTITATPAVGVLTKVAPSTSTAYAYWRYLGPTNGYCDIAEFELFGSSGTASVTQRTGTTYGTSGSYGNVAANTVAAATDGNLNTFFDAPTASGGNVGINLGSAQTITEIKFAPRSGFASRMVGGEFQVSTSMTFSSDVTTVYTITSTPVTGSLTTISLNLGTAYQYWRYIGPTNGYCNIAEFELFG